MDTLLINVGKILDKSTKITMFCVRVVEENNRGFKASQRGKIGGILVFLKVKIIGKKGVIFVEILAGFYCLFVASLSSKKGIKSPIMKHQKRDKIGMLEGGKMYKNV